MAKRVQLHAHYLEIYDILPIRAILWFFGTSATATGAVFELEKDAVFAKDGVLSMGPGF